MTTICHSELNCGIKRWVIDAPGSSQYEECAEGEWCEWDDVSAALMRLDGEHRARVRELEQKVELGNRAWEHSQEELADARAERNKAEAKVRELEAERDKAVRDRSDGDTILGRTIKQLAAAEQKLADASALLDRVETSIGKSLPPELREDIHTHHAGQPAAPSRTPLPPRSIAGRPELTEEFPDDAAPSRTEAERLRVFIGGRIEWANVERLDGVLTMIFPPRPEADQAVLKRAALIPEENLRWWMNHCCPTLPQIRHFAAGELARRGLK